MDLPTLESFQDELEKIAVTMQQLSAGAKRIAPTFLRLPKGKTVQDVAMSTMMGRPTPVGATAIAGGAMTVRTPAIHAALGEANINKLGPGLIRRAQKVQPDFLEQSRQGAQMMPTLMKKPGIYMAQPATGGSGLVGVQRQVPQLRQPLSAIKTPKGSRGYQDMTTMHESYESKVPKRLIDPVGGHLSPRVLFHEGNMLARAEGPGSQEARKALLGVRRDVSGEAGLIDGAVQKAYGGRFPYTYGSTKMPKAMQKDLMRKSMAGRAQFDNGVVKRMTTEQIEVAEAQRKMYGAPGKKRKAIKGVKN